MLSYNPKSRWGSSSLVALSSSDFDTNPNAANPAIPPDRKSPNFTSSGSPISFGYLLTNSLPGGGSDTFIYGVDNWSVSFKSDNTCILDAGINVCELQAGDILVQKQRASLVSTGMGLLGGTYYTHGAIYIGDNKVIEALGYGDNHQQEIVECDIRPGMESGWSDGPLDDWAVVRPRASQSVKISAINYAKNQVANEILRYDIDADRNDVDKVYCTLLVWRAYFQAGLDLESGRGTVTEISDWVTPDDLYYSFDIFSEKSDIVQKKGAGVLDSIDRWLLYIHSPAHIMLIDPNGRRTGFDPETGRILEEIPGVLYTNDGAALETVSVTSDGSVGNWQLVLTGYEQGIYTIDAGSVDGDSPAKILEGSTHPGKIERFTILDPTLTDDIQIADNVYLPSIRK